MIKPRMLRTQNQLMKVKSQMFIQKQVQIELIIVNKLKTRIGLSNYLKVHSKVKIPVKKLTLNLQAYEKVPASETMKLIQ